MTEKTDQILSEIRELKSWLYGANGYEGDIPEIKASLKNNANRITRLELIIAGLIGSGVLGGGIVGITKLLGG